MKIVSIVGARPNFVKLAALHSAFQNIPDIEHRIVHTGQHYDYNLSQLFFQELQIPAPDYYLGVGSGTHAQQVGKTMIALEQLLTSEFTAPDWVLVTGDVNATLAAALVSKKIGLRLTHVEAGLRSFDWNMPEEINRIVTDRLSDLLFVSDPSGIDNLLSEGVPEERIKFVGNVMIDTLMSNLHLADKRPIMAELGLGSKEYGLITLHRPSNVDDPDKLQAWMHHFESLSTEMGLVFVVHPRTQSRLASINYRPPDSNRLRLIEPIGYLDMLALQTNARLVMTDSGGIQEETTMLAVPCLTLRNNTERPVTISAGTNLLIGSTPAKLPHFFSEVLKVPIKDSRPPLWDGKAAQRVANCLLNHSDLPRRNK